MKIIDISQPLGKGLITYPGDPTFTLKRVKQLPKDRVTLSSLDMGSHNGTHLDAPAHFIAKGKTLDKIPLDRFYGSARVLDVRMAAWEITPKHVWQAGFRNAKIVLLKTKNSERPWKKFNEKFIHLGLPAAKFLLKHGVKTIGIDGPSIEVFHSPDHAVHLTLLKAGVVIYENLSLGKVKQGMYQFSGFPLKLDGAEASPVRAILFR